jgi:hypothetical protein
MDFDILMLIRSRKSATWKDGRPYRTSAVTLARSGWGAHLLDVRSIRQIESGDFYSG